MSQPTKQRRPKAIKLGDPSIEELREAIKEGYCWWCETTGWRVLSIHTSHIHSIYADDIRKMAFLFKHIPTCLPEHSFACALRPQTILNLPKMRIAPRTEYILSEAGRASAVKKLLAVSSNDQRRRASYISAAKHRKPHPCPACGKILPTSHPITCSPECRRIIRQQTALAVCKQRYQGGEG